MQFGSRQISLRTADRHEAFKEYKRLLAIEEARRIDPRRTKVYQCFDLFLEHSKENHAERTYAGHRDTLSHAAKSFGKLLIDDLKVHHITTWLRSMKLSDTTQSHYIGMVKAAINYCVKQGHIEKNPIAHMQKPSCAVRERIMTPEEQNILFASVRDKRFKDFLLALHESGARPSEIAGLKPEHVNLEGGYCVLHRHKNARKTKKPCFIFCTDTLLALLKEHIAQTEPGDYLFKTRQGKPWSRHSMYSRFRVLRRKYPELAGVVPYSIRHGFITDSLEKGIPDAVVAQLCGNSPEIIHRNYNHLSQKIKMLRTAAALARSANA
ncbi:MAG TPA: tyrosine-type recombinase/integrase [Gemmataceae bacterium]|nr:tyrosine-type recombinase/integrase [Gemmataceae bacterium]